MRVKLVGYQYYSKYADLGLKTYFWFDPEEKSWNLETRCLSPRRAKNIQKKPVWDALPKRAQYAIRRRAGMTVPKTKPSKLPTKRELLSVLPQLISDVMGEFAISTVRDFIHGLGNKSLSKRNPVWIKLAMRAYEDSRSRRGICSQRMYLSEQFEEVVDRAVIAYCRHRYTDYDNSGYMDEYDREQRRAECNREVRLRLPNKYQEQQQAHCV